MSYVVFRLQLDNECNGVIVISVEWLPELETKYENIDTQHRQLFSLLNELLEGCSRDADAETLRKALVQYTQRHFNEEESLQRIYDYPGYNRHKQQHEAFKSMVFKMVDQFTDNASPAKLANELNRVVAHWFLQHIRNEDIKMIWHIRAEMPGGIL